MFLRKSAFISGFSILVSTSVMAEIPQTPHYNQFSHLLKNSPFEIKLNEMVKVVDKPQVRMDYFLRGVTKLQSGWMIVLVDRKKPKENIILKQGLHHSSKILLVDVIQNNDDYKLTTARLKLGTQQMTVGYNTSELKMPKSSPPPAGPSLKANEQAQKPSNKVKNQPALNQTSGEAKRTRPTFK